MFSYSLRRMNIFLIAASYKVENDCLWDWVYTFYSSVTFTGDYHLHHERWRPYLPLKAPYKTHYLQHSSSPSQHAKISLLRHPPAYKFPSVPISLHPTSILHPPYIHPSTSFFNLFSGHYSCSCINTRTTKYTTVFLIQFLILVDVTLQCLLTLS